MMLVFNPQLLRGKNIMWTNNQLARQLEISIPLVQAPMAGGATTPELVAAVSNAGALGSLGAGYMAPKQIKAAISQIRQLTTAPFAVNLFIPNQYEINRARIHAMQEIIKQEVTLELGDTRDYFSVDLSILPDFDEQMEVIIAEKVPVFSFTFGVLPSAYVRRLKENNTILIGTATTSNEAKILEASGVDIIVAQGYEAGGHRGTFDRPLAESLVGLMALVPQIKAQIKLPVLASGGIMDAAAIMAALNLGAAGVQMGTAFLTKDESGVNEHYKQVLLNQAADNTILTRCFSGKMARGIKNTFITRMDKYAADILDYPLQHCVTQPMRTQAASLGNPEFLSLWAGQGAPLCKRGKAADMVNELDIQVKLLTGS